MTFVVCLLPSLTTDKDNNHTNLMFHLFLFNALLVSFHNMKQKDRDIYKVQDISVLNNPINFILSRALVVYDILVSIQHDKIELYSGDVYL